MDSDPGREEVEDSRNIELENMIISVAFLLITSNLSGVLAKLDQVANP